MTLREELKDRADKLDAELLDLSGRIKEIERQSSELHTCLNALDIAEMDAEDEAREWAEAERLPVTDEQPELFDEPQEIEASSQSESCVLSLGAETDLQTSPGEAEESRDQFKEEAERAAAIELTADVIPESGLHDEAPALNEAMQDEREQPVEPYPTEELARLPEPVWYDVPTEGYAPVTNLEAHVQAVEAERYAQPTNPEADALAKAHDWYDPKAVHDRNRFNPWGGVAHLFGKPKVDA